MNLRFRKFPIYVELREFVKAIYLLTNSFPKSEEYGLSSQLRRASTSIILNLAEGAMKKSDAEFARFLAISIGSLSEVVAILDLCLDLEYITASKHKEFMIKCENLIKKLYGFRRRVKSSSDQL